VKAMMIAVIAAMSAPTPSNPPLGTKNSPTNNKKKMSSNPMVYSNGISY
jgi:hypothetical protein